MSRHDLLPGVWSDDDGTLHIDIDATLIAHGYEPNAKNRTTVLDAWRYATQTMGIELVEEPPS